MPYAITANRLEDGRVVFRDRDGGWSLTVAEAALSVDEASSSPALDSAQKDVENQRIVDPYAVEIDTTGPSPRPARLREAIRAFGPTVSYGPVPLLEAAE
jgi:hypothetical protein